MGEEAAISSSDARLIRLAATVPAKSWVAKRRGEDSMTVLARLSALLPRERHELPIVDGDATAMEVAAVMAGLRSQLVAVIDAGRFLGAITTARLIARMLRSP